VKHLDDCRARRRREEADGDPTGSRRAPRDRPSGAGAPWNPGAGFANAALAFRGYDATNYGRGAELVAHPVHGPIARRWLTRASAACAAAIGEPVDLAARLADGRPTSLDQFPEDVATIIALELSQLEALEHVAGADPRAARLSIGYSVGELAALAYGGTFDIESILEVPLALARDCAGLAEGSTLAVVFARGAELEPEALETLCRAVASEGRGLIGPSAYLSPNSALVIGEGETIARLEARVGEFLPEGAAVRRKEHRWPPLHSPLVWRKHIPTRAALMAYGLPGGDRAPTPPVVSCVTGEASYDDTNVRDTLVRWTDQPQKLWDVIDATLASGVSTVVHVGPAPNLIPATFARLANNVRRQVGGVGLDLWGPGVVSGLNRHSWLGRMLPSRANLLRAPFLRQVVLEDWLLDGPAGTRAIVGFAGASPGAVGPVTIAADPTATPAPAAP